MAGSRKVLSSLIVLGMVLSTFTAAVSVVATSLPLNTIPYLSLAPTENLVGYWRFDETSGSTASDSSGMGNNGTVNGATWASGKVGNALNFDGNDEVEVPHSSSLALTGPFTISAWVNIQVADTEARTIVSKSTFSSGDQPPYLLRGSNRFNLYVTKSYNVYEEVHSTTQIQPNTWYHVAGVYTGTELRLYVNGTLDTSKATFVDSIYDITKPLTIGFRYWKDNSKIEFFKGLVDEVSIYGRALTGSEILALYQEGAAAPTTLTVLPSTFTLSSGSPTTLTATLTSGGSPVAGKTITWTKSAGSLSTTSGTTNSSGQVTVTYTAPTVTATTSVTVTASFAGDDSYQASSGTSSGAIEPVRETIMSVSPPKFALYPGYSGQVQSLTVTLRDGNYTPLANKTITWLATSGSVSPSSGTTDPLGQVTVTYTAPTVTAETPQVTITASFAGDNQHDPSSGTSSGVPAVVSENIPASTGGTVVINVIEINVTVNVLVVRPNSIPEDTTVTVVQALPENLPDYAMVSEIFDIGPSGTTFTTPSTLTLPYDENELPAGVSEDDLAIYQRTGQGKSWERVGGNVDRAANTVSVEIDHLSEYAVMAQLPTQPFAAVPPIWVIAAAALGLLSVLIAMVWFHLREARGDATSVLIEHGLPDMRITEVEVVREIRGRGEFTIPDLVQRTGASRVLVWRTVKKLAEKGLVRPTTEVRLPATGRGKPSRVYEYVGD